MLLRHSFVVLALVALGCGGSSSETPWPAEPEGKLLGPAGEMDQSFDDPSAAKPDGGAPNVDP